MRLDQKFELDGEVHSATVETTEWQHGISVIVTVCDRKNVRH